jgi:hypothetical protein
VDSIAFLRKGWTPFAGEVSDMMECVAAEILSLREERDRLLNEKNKSMNNDSMKKHLVHTQVWEWHRHHAHAWRATPKGGDSFIVELPDEIAYDEEAIRELWNSHFNVFGKRWMCYEFRGIETYYEPRQIKYEGGVLINDDV